MRGRYPCCEHCGFPSDWHRLENDEHTIPCEVDGCPGQREITVTPEDLSRHDQSGTPPPMGPDTRRPRLDAPPNALGPRWGAICRLSAITPGDVRRLELALGLPAGILSDANVKRLT